MTPRPDAHTALSPDPARHLLRATRASRTQCGGAKGQTWIARPAWRQSGPAISVSWPYKQYRRRGASRISLAASMADGQRKYSGITVPRSRHNTVTTVAVQFFELRHRRGTGTVLSSAVLRLRHRAVSRRVLRVIAIADHAVEIDRLRLDRGAWVYSKTFPRDALKIGQFPPCEGSALPVFKNGRIRTRSMVQ